MCFLFLEPTGGSQKRLTKKKNIAQRCYNLNITWVPPNPTLENSFKKTMSQFQDLGKQPLDGGMKNCGGPLHPPLHPLPHLSCSSCWHNFSNSLWQRRFWSKNASKLHICGEKTYLGTKYSINVQHLGWFRSILSVTTKLKLCHLQICSYLTYNPSKLAWHHCWLDVAPSTNSGFCIAILDGWNAPFLPQWTFTKKRMTLLSYRKGKIFCWIMIIGGRFKMVYPVYHTSKLGALGFGV